jgi:ATP-dependent helicase/nuclease subunit B
LFTSPRAADRITAAGEWLAAFAPATEVLTVTSAWDAADDLVRMLASARGARFGIHRFTLNALVARLAAPELAAAGLAPAIGLATHAVAARTAYLLGAQNALGYFAPVGTRPGFPSAAANTIEELRLSGIGAERLRDFDRIGAPLAAMLSRFESELAAASLTDRRGVVEAATRALRLSEPGALPSYAGKPALFVDLQIQNESEMRFVSALAGQVSLIFATLPTADERTLSFLSQALGSDLRRVPNRPVSGASSLSRLQEHLFCGAAPPPRKLDSSVAICSAPGESRECVEIAREIQAQARAGLPYDRMAVFLHAPALYTAHLDEAFRRAGIPAYFARGAARPEPGGRAMLILLACAAERLSARRYAEYLSLAQVPGFDEVEGASSSERFVAPDSDFSTPDASTRFTTENAESDFPIAADPVPVVEGTLRAPWRWEKLIVEAAVIGSKDRWRRRLVGLRNELESKRGEVEEDDPQRRRIERQIVDLDHLSAVALPHIDALARLPPQAKWSEWLDHLRALAEIAVRDREPVLAALAALAPMGPVGPVSLDEVRQVLANCLGELAPVPLRRRYGAVFVAPTSAARGLSFDLVFVPGLSEKIFPRKTVEDPILRDSYRLALGNGLIRQVDRVAAERLALHLAIGAASTKAVLSYPRIDIDQGRARVPSFYALEILRAAEGTLPAFEELKTRAAATRDLRLGWPAPESPEDAIDEAEFDLASLVHLLDTDPLTNIGTANYLLGANEHLARALRARARRWLRRWTPADGLVDPDPLARQALAAHQVFTARSYSATALQHFASCPYKFLLQAVHRLAPREDPEAIEVIDPLIRGKLFHEVQFELLSALKQSGSLPVDGMSLFAAQERAERILDTIASRYKDELAPAIDRVWAEGIALIGADLREWLRRMANEAERWIPDRFELSFGLQERKQADPASQSAPVEIEGELKLRGSIDLIERRSDGCLRVTDHKTGRVWAKAGVVIGGGEILQPMLYALAAEKLLGDPVRYGRLYYCTAAGKYEDRVVAIDEKSRAAAAEAISIVGAALKRGFLPAAPAADKCRLCDYKIVCGPYEEMRVRQRKPEKGIAELKRLRAMP